MRLRGEQTGSRATTFPLAGSNGARGHVPSVTDYPLCVHAQFCFTGTCINGSAAFLVPLLCLFFFLMLFTCSFSLLVCSAFPVCWAFLRNHILNSKIPISMPCASTYISVPWISYAPVHVSNLGMTQSFCLSEQITLPVIPSYHHVTSDSTGFHLV